MAVTCDLALHEWLTTVKLELHVFGCNIGSLLAGKLVYMF